MAACPMALRMFTTLNYCPKRIINIDLMDKYWPDGFNPLTCIVLILYIIFTLQQSVPLQAKARAPALITVVMGIILIVLAMTTYIIMKMVMTTHIIIKMVILLFYFTLFCHTNMTTLFISATNATKCGCIEMYFGKIWNNRHETWCIRCKT